MLTWTHLEEHDLSVRALSISGIREGIKDLFQCHYLTSSTVNALPYNAIGLYVCVGVCVCVCVCVCMVGLW